MAWTVRGIVRSTLPVLLALTALEVGSGLVLGSFETTLLEHPVLLVLVPVTIGTAGNLGSILAARLSTAIHLGVLSPSLTDDRLAANAAATVGLAVTVFPAIGASAWGLSAAVDGATLALRTVAAVSLASGLPLALLAVGVATVATVVAYRLGLDPDDVVVPIVTNTCDVLGVVVLLGAVRWLV